MESIIVNREIFNLKKDEAKDIKLLKPVISENVEYQVEYDWTKYIDQDINIHLVLWKNFGQARVSQSVILDGEPSQRFPIDQNVTDGSSYDHLKVVADRDVIVVISVFECHQTGIEL